MRQPRLDAQSGFSMVELMVAMTITLMISGAIFGLLSGGNETFRREPVLADRQQNIRLAMDLITRDVQGGAGFMTANGVGINGPNGTATDGIFLLTRSLTCPEVPVSNVNTSGPVINIAYPMPGCYSNNTLVLVFFDNGSAKAGFGVGVHSAGTAITFPSTQPEINVPLKTIVTACNPGATPCPERLGNGDFVKWQIANDTDGTPSLWRTATGGYDAAGTLTAAPAAPSWQLVARGIEDMRVTYRIQSNYSSADLTTGWTAMPTGGAGTFDNLVREVRVTLQARTVGQALLFGESAVAAGPNAVRGQLTTVITPVSTLTELAQNSLYVN